MIYYKCMCWFNNTYATQTAALIATLIVCIDADKIYTTFVGFYEFFSALYCVASINSTHRHAQPLHVEILFGSLLQPNQGLLQVTKYKILNKRNEKKSQQKTFTNTLKINASLPDKEH